MDDIFNQILSQQQQQPVMGRGVTSPVAPSSPLQAGSNAAIQGIYNNMQMNGMDRQRALGRFIANFAQTANTPIPGGDSGFGGTIDRVNLGLNSALNNYMEDQRAAEHRNLQLMKMQYEMERQAQHDNLMRERFEEQKEHHHKMQNKKDEGYAKKLKSDDKGTHYYRMLNKDLLELDKREEKMISDEIKLLPYDKQYGIEREKEEAKIRERARKKHEKRRAEIYRLLEKYKPKESNISAPSGVDDAAIKPVSLKLSPPLEQTGYPAIETQSSETDALIKDSGW